MDQVDRRRRTGAGGGAVAAGAAGGCGRSVSAGTRRRMAATETPDLVAARMTGTGKVPARIISYAVLRVKPRISAVVRRSVNAPRARMRSTVQEAGSPGVVVVSMAGGLPRHGVMR